MRHNLVIAFAVVAVVAEGGVVATNYSYTDVSEPGAWRVTVNLYDGLPVYWLLNQRNRTNDVNWFSWDPDRAVGYRNSDYLDSGEYTTSWQDIVSAQRWLLNMKTGAYEATWYRMGPAGSGFIDFVLQGGWQQGAFPGSIPSWHRGGIQFMGRGAGEDFSYQWPPAYPTSTNRHPSGYVMGLFNQTNGFREGWSDQTWEESAYVSLSNCPPGERPQWAVTSTPAWIFQSYEKRGGVQSNFVSWASYIRLWGLSNDFRAPVITTNRQVVRVDTAFTRYNRNEALTYEGEGGQWVVTNVSRLSTGRARWGYEYQGSYRMRLRFVCNAPAE